MVKYRHMSHISLYRKYRPETWDQVLGQESIINDLKKSIDSGHVAHAYLFTGSRGTGKTSVARIFAKSLGVSQNDLYEIDAASHNGVEQIRELRDGVTTLPFDSRYKVYILDEAHMLSKQAFNALLKTLEEPPAHVIFILATTEPEKIIDTVKSRCQMFEFKKPDIATLVTMIKQGCEKENFSIDDESAFLIAQMGDGAFRDAWGILDRVMRTSTDNKITIDDVLTSLGKPSRIMIHNLVQSCIEDDLDAVLGTVHILLEKNISPELILDGVIETVRLVLLYRFSPDTAQKRAVDVSDEAKQNIQSWAKEKNIINAQLLADLLSSLDNLKKSSLPHISLELAFMKILGNNG